MYFRTAEPMTAQGTRKGEPSLSSMRNGLRPQPARLVRGSSRRIMSMRFRPANIRVINRRESSSLSSARLSEQVNAQGSPAGTCSRYAARRRCSSMPERCSTARVCYAAPNSGAPLPSPRRSGRLGLATGGSGGNTSAPSSTPEKKRPVFLLIRRKTGLASGINQSRARNA